MAVAAAALIWSGLLRAAGKAKLDGSRDPYELLKRSLVQFDMGFEILPGTGGTHVPTARSPFQQDSPARTDGG